MHPGGLNEKHSPLSCSIPSLAGGVDGSAETMSSSVVFSAPAVEINDVSDALFDSTAAGKRFRHRLHHSVPMRSFVPW